MRWYALAVLLGVAVLQGADARGDGVTVRYREGVVHALLALKTLDGKLLASGDLVETPSGDRVTSRLTFRFRDGSTDDETTVFSERGRFKMIRYRLVQSGPAFPESIDLSVDGTTGDVSVRHARAGQAPEVESEHLDPVPDLANGIVPVLLKNVGSRPPDDLAMVVATPKPRLVHLAISTAPDESFSAAGAVRKARHFVIKAEIGGITGVLAKLAGKQPPDSHVWVLESGVPEFLKSEQPLYAGGPLWRIELADATGLHPASPRR